MAIHRPDVFHNTIGAVSISTTQTPVETYESATPVAINSNANSTNTITPKNIISNQPASLHKVLFEASWLGYYLITFSASAIGGTDKVWLLEPYKNTSALGYGKINFMMESVGGEGQVPSYEISSTFIAKLQKDDAISFYTTLVSEEAPSVDFYYKNMQITAYQLEQVGLH